MFELDQKIDKVFCLFQIAYAVLVPPSRDVLDDGTFDKTQVICMDVLHWLNSQSLVMISINLGSQR